MRKHGQLDVRLICPVRLWRTSHYRLIQLGAVAVLGRGCLLPVGRVWTDRHCFGKRAGRFA